MAMLKIHPSSARVQSPATDFEMRGRHLGVRMLDTGTEEVFRVLFLEDTTRAREEAQQLKLAALGRLTANIAHEIRNPLAAISHAAELLGEERRDTQRGRLTRIIHDNTLRLERLVAEVLQLSRRDRQAPEKIPLRRWLLPFIEEFVANESVPPERFLVEVPAEAAIEFDPGHLHQVMWNLLRNAVRYAREEPGAVRLALSAFELTSAAHALALAVEPFVILAAGSSPSGRRRARAPPWRSGCSAPRSCSWPRRAPSTRPG